MQANIYYNLNQLDSGRIYFNQALEISLRVNDDENAAAVYLNLENGKFQNEAI